MRFKPDQIGPWSEVKLQILEKYAQAFSKIIASQPHPFRAIYIDGFAGAGWHRLKGSGAQISGTPLRVVDVDPPFAEYHFVDLKPSKVKELQFQIGSRPNVKIYQGDCNKVLLEQVFPTMTFDSFRKGFCLLDPYGLHLRWEVIEAAGRLETMDLILNFPLMDMNLNAIRNDRSSVTAKDRQRMTDFWGDESWSEALYRKRPNLFEEEEEKVSNSEVVEAFVARLKSKAGFKFVSKPLPMKSLTGSTIYYLIGASQKKDAVGVINDIFKRQEKRGPERV